MSVDEKETSLNLSAVDRRNGGDWELYSDDGAILTKLKRAGHVPYKTSAVGGGFFRIPADCVSFRRARTPKAKGMSQNVERNGSFDGKQGNL